MKKRVKLIKRDKSIPLKYDEVVPFMAGESLKWSIEDIDINN